MAQENISSTGSETGNTAAASARLSYMHARDAAQQVVGQAKERATEYYERGRAKAADMRAKVEASVRDYPMRSVLIAAGAGLLIGMLLGHRR